MIRTSILFWIKKMSLSYTYRKHNILYWPFIIELRGAESSTLLDHDIDISPLFSHGRDTEDTFLLVIKGSLITPAMFVLQSCIVLNGVVDTAGRCTHYIINFQTFFSIFKKQL